MRVRVGRERHRTVSVIRAEQVWALPSSCNLRDIRRRSGLHLPRYLSAVGLEKKKPRDKMTDTHRWLDCDVNGAR